MTTVQQELEQAMHEELTRPRGVTVRIVDCSGEELELAFDTGVKVERRLRRKRVRRAYQKGYDAGARRWLLIGLVIGLVAGAML